jgi:hypothetical protein
MYARLSQEVLDARYDRESLCLEAFEEYGHQKREGKMSEEESWENG